MPSGAPQERRLRDAEERFAKAFSASPLILTVTSLRTGRLLEVNETFTRLTGYAREEAVGRTTLELGLWERAEDRDEELLALAASGGLRNREYRFRHRDGSTLWGLLSAEMVEVDGEPCALSTIADVSELKHAQEALLEADRAKDRFLAVLSHELRNPLAPIRNAVAILRNLGHEDPRVVWCGEVIERQAAHMARLLEDLLDVSRIKEGLLSIHPERADLQEVLDHAIETSRPLIEGAGQELRLFGRGRGIAVSGDAARLAQVFSNLLNNASRYSERGGTIDLVARAEGLQAIVEVRDRGIGIPAEQLPHLFEMFAQADPRQDRSLGGLGIGLALARGLVELHGGLIDVRSDGPGSGSVFTVRLPLAGEAAPAAIEAAGAGPPGEPLPG